jgi:hypothetical protein
MGWLWALAWFPSSVVSTTLEKARICENSGTNNPAVIGRTVMTNEGAGIGGK